MVGGGSLSLPLAFHQTGNMFVAPLLLFATGAVAQQSIIFLIKAGIYSTGSSENGNSLNGGMDRNRTLGSRKGTASYENVALKAFGPSARVFSMALVSACCFFGSIGYCVLVSKSVVVERHQVILVQNFNTKLMRARAAERYA
jgi:amino acid permease